MVSFPYFFFVGVPIANTLVFLWAVCLTIFSFDMYLYFILLSTYIVYVNCLCFLFHVLIMYLDLRVCIVLMFKCFFICLPIFGCLIIVQWEYICDILFDLGVYTLRYLCWMCCNGFPCYCVSIGQDRT